MDTATSTFAALAKGDTFKFDVKFNGVLDHTVYTKLDAFTFTAGTGKIMLPNPKTALVTPVGTIWTH